MLHPCVQALPRYYERLASLLRDADEILIFGNGKGNSSAMVQLIRYLSKHHMEQHQLLIQRSEGRSLNFLFQQQQRLGKSRAPGDDPHGQFTDTSLRYVLYKGEHRYQPTYSRSKARNLIPSSYVQSNRRQ